MGILQDGDRWMDDRDEDMDKIWLENLSEDEYRAHKDARRLELQDRENQRLAARTTVQEQ